MHYLCTNPIVTSKLSQSVTGFFSVAYWRWGLIVPPRSMTAGFASIAQLIEQSVCTRTVVGLTPTGSSNVG